jgi:hypothetical protein
MGVFGGGVFGVLVVTWVDTFPRAWTWLWLL